MRPIEHGDSYKRLYRIWKNMKYRANPKTTHRQLINYRKHNISVCDSWKSYQSFRSDMLPSYLKHIAMYGENETTIDRIDSIGGYNRDNCRWATRREQTLNRTNGLFIKFEGITLPLSEWSLLTGIAYHTLRKRIVSGWNTREALTKQTK